MLRIPLNIEVVHQWFSCIPVTGVVRPSFALVYVECPKNTFIVKTGTYCVRLVKPKPRPHPAVHNKEFCTTNHACKLTTEHLR